TGPTVPGAYVGRGLKSEEDDQYKFVLSAPVVRGGRCVGVLLATTLTDSALGRFQMTDPADPRRTGVLIAPLDRSRGEPLSVLAQHRYFILLHGDLRPGVGVAVDPEVAQ